MKWTPDNLTPDLENNAANSRVQYEEPEEQKCSTDESTMDTSRYLKARFLGAIGTVFDMF